MELKKAAVTGAVVGAIASLVFGRKRGGKLEKAATYAAAGAGVAALGNYVLEKSGHHVAGELAGWGNEHEFGHPNHGPFGFGHGGAWGNPEDRRYARRF